LLRKIDPNPTRLAIAYPPWYANMSAIIPKRMSACGMNRAVSVKNAATDGVVAGPVGVLTERASAVTKIPASVEIRTANHGTVVSVLPAILYLRDTCFVV
jgi:hypothetical protein